MIVYDIEADGLIDFHRKTAPNITQFACANVAKRNGKYVIAKYHNWYLRDFNVTYNYDNFKIAGLDPRLWAEKAEPASSVMKKVAVILNGNYVTGKNNMNFDRKVVQATYGKYYSFMGPLDPYFEQDTFKAIDGYVTLKERYEATAYFRNTGKRKGSGTLKDFVIALEIPKPTPDDPIWEVDNIFSVYVELDYDGIQQLKNESTFTSGDKKFYVDLERLTLADPNWRNATSKYGFYHDFKSAEDYKVWFYATEDNGFHNALIDVYYTAQLQIMLQQMLDDQNRQKREDQERLRIATERDVMQNGF